MKLDLLETKISYKFCNHKLLKSALIHPSHDLSPSGAKQRKSYQRLEFLGDAALSLAIIDLAYHRYPNASEGELALFHGNVVKSHSVGKVAKAIGLGEHIIYGKSDLSNAEFRGLEDAMEALLGAIYLDTGYEQVKVVVQQLWNKFLLHDEEAVEFTRKSAKSRLQEHLQRQSRGLPSYALLESSGTDHEPLFIVEVMTSSGEQAVGQGRNKKAAEEAAAQAMLYKIDASGGGAKGKC